MDIYEFSKKYYLLVGLDIEIVDVHVCIVVPIFSEMTKTGKPDAYWAGILYQYAQEKYRFTTVKKLGSRTWKAVMQCIDACPLTPL